MADVGKKEVRQASNLLKKMKRDSGRYLKMLEKQNSTGEVLMIMVENLYRINILRQSLITRFGDKLPEDDREIENYITQVTDPTLKRIYSDLKSTLNKLAVYKEQGKDKSDLGQPLKPFTDDTQKVFDVLQEEMQRRGISVSDL